MAKELEFGRNGFDTLDLAAGASTYGAYHALWVTSDVEFTVFTEENGSTPPTSTPAGSWIYGKITEITVASGEVMAYKYINQTF